MSKDKEFCEFIVQDALADVAGVTSRAMFGGYGIYKEGIIFAIIADGELYFKVDAKTQKKYEQKGSHPFTYEMPGKKTMTMSYYTLPEEILEDREEIVVWVDEAVQVSRDSKKKKSKNSH